MHSLLFHSRHVIPQRVPDTLGIIQQLCLRSSCCSQWMPLQLKDVEVSLRGVALSTSQSGCWMAPRHQGVPAAPSSQQRPFEKIHSLRFTVSAKHTCGSTKHKHTPATQFLPTSCSGAHSSAYCSHSSRGMADISGACVRARLPAST